MLGGSLASSSSGSRSLQDREHEIRDLQPGSFLTPQPWYFYRQGYPEPIKSALDDKLSSLRSKETSGHSVLRMLLRLEGAKVRLSQASANWEGAAKELARVRTEIATELADPSTWSAEERAALEDAHDEALYLSSVFQVKQALKIRFLDRPAAAAVAAQLDAYIRATAEPFSTNSDPERIFRAFLNQRQTWGPSLLTTWVIADYEATPEQADASPSAIRAMELLSQQSPMNPWYWLYLGMLQFDSSRDRDRAERSSSRGVQVLEAWFTHAPELQSLASLSRNDLFILQDPTWLCEPYGAEHRSSMKSQYLTDVGGIAGYRARLLRTEIKFGIPDLLDQRGWSGALARDILWARAMPEQAAYDVGATSEMDVMRYPGGGFSFSGRMMEQRPQRLAPAPTVTIVFTGRGKEQETKTYSVFGRGTVVQPSTFRNSSDPSENLRNAFDASKYQIEEIVDEQRASERRSERDPQWWETAIPCFAERTGYYADPITNVPISTITGALVLPSGQRIPPELAVGLTIIDPRGEEVATGSWALDTEAVDTQELHGFEDVVVEIRQLPNGQTALAFDIIEELPSGEYSARFQFDDGEVVVGAPMGTIQVDSAQPFLQLADLQIMLRGADGAHFVNPVDVIWKQAGTSELAVQVSLHNLTGDSEQISNYGVRYALFPLAEFYRSVRPLLDEEARTGRGATLPHEALSFAAGGRWLDKPPATAEIVPEFWVSTTLAPDGTPLQLQSRNSGVAKINAFLDISEVPTGEHILLAEATDYLARAITHRLVRVEIAEPGVPLRQPTRTLAHVR